MTSVRIYHNPGCSKSRQTLALLQENGQDPEIVLYLESPPDQAELTRILTQLGLNPRDIIRPGETAYTEMNLGDESLSNDELIDAIIKAPILMQRPIVVANDQARIGRPPESVLEIL